MSDDMERFQLSGSIRDVYFADEVDTKINELESMLCKVKMWLISQDPNATPANNMRLIGEINEVLQDMKHTPFSKIWNIIRKRRFVSSYDLANDASSNKWDKEIQYNWRLDLPDRRHYNSRLLVVFCGILPGSDNDRRQPGIRERTLLRRHKTEGTGFGQEPGKVCLIVSQQSLSETTMSRPEIAKHSATRT